MFEQDKTKINNNIIYQEIFPYVQFFIVFLSARKAEHTFIFQFFLYKCVLLNAEGSLTRSKK